MTNESFFLLGFICYIIVIKCILQYSLEGIKMLQPFIHSFNQPPKFICKGNLESFQVRGRRPGTVTN